MIISQTPLRISLLGGATDFPEHYEKHGGACLSFTVDRYLYVILKRRYDEDIYIGWGDSQQVVQNYKMISHDIAREALGFMGIEGGIEIKFLADIPSKGSGLGSSSACAVGLLNALGVYAGTPFTKSELLGAAIEVEINLVGSPIGHQDQAAATYGGMNLFEFSEHETITVTNYDDVAPELLRHLVVFFTGHTRQANRILSQQCERMADNTDTLAKMYNNTMGCVGDFVSGDVEAVWHGMEKQWGMKTSLANGITNDHIDYLIDKAKSNGALAAKITGAGGGGYLICYCEPKDQGKLRRAMCMEELPVGLDRQGSRILLNVER